MKRLESKEYNASCPTQAVKYTRQKSVSMQKHFLLVSIKTRSSLLTTRPLSTVCELTLISIDQSESYTVACLFANWQVSRIKCHLRGCIDYRNANFDVDDRFRAGDINDMLTIFTERERTLFEPQKSDLQTGLSHWDAPAAPLIEYCIFTNFRCVKVSVLSDRGPFGLV